MRAYWEPMSKLGFIGCGKMAAAILQGVVNSGVFPVGTIYLSDNDTARVTDLAASCGAKAMATNLATAKAAEVLLLCVKPGDLYAVLPEIRPALRSKLIISIAAGMPLSLLSELCGKMAKIVRVMPNTPALVHRGASAYAPRAGVTEEQCQTVEKIFGAVGKVWRVKESALDAVTGVSGSGPAYIYTVIEAMADGGVLMGLSRELALQLAAQTVVGAGEMVLQTQMHPAALRDMVTSPGGTTIAAVEKLEEHGARAGFIAAVRAATEKSILIRQAAVQ